MRFARIRFYFSLGEGFPQSLEKLTAFNDCEDGPDLSDDGR